MLRALVPVREEIPNNGEISEDVEVQGERCLDFAIILETKIS
jgi:hypothetical protein